MEMYYYLYRITNLINGKIYVGVHKTTNIDDGYMGSGILIRRAIEKYGIENFEKIILRYFTTEDEMFEAESVLVNEEFKDRDDTYNIKEGGQGGWDHINDGSLNHINRCRRGAKITHNLLRTRLTTDLKFKEKFQQLSGARLKELHAQGKMIYTGFSGKHHLEDAKSKIGAANSKHQSGSGNSQFGKIWIYNEDLKECTRIPKDDPIPEGWKRGRKMNF